MNIVLKKSSAWLTMRTTVFLFHDWGTCLGLLAIGCGPPSLRMDLAIQTHLCHQIPEPYHLASASELLWLC